MIAAALLALSLTSPAFGMVEASPIPRFSHLQIEDGLSQATVTCMTQDPRGFMWFGTQEGLNRYDGHKVTVFMPNPDVPGSISHNYIYAMLVDHQGQLWVCTSDGLNLYDRMTETFNTFRPPEIHEDGACEKPLVAIIEDDEGKLWLGTQGHGLLRFDPTNGHFDTFVHDPADASSLSGDLVNAIGQDAAGRIWVGTNNGLNRFHRKQGSFDLCRVMANLPGGPDRSTDKTILSILPDPDGTLWIGTDVGLHRLNLEARTCESFPHDPNNPLSPAPGGIVAMAKDFEGHLWLGSNQSGLDHFHPETGRAQHVRHSYRNPESLADDRILSLYVDQSSVLWVGTYSRGVDRYDRLSTLFTPAHSTPEIADGEIDYVRAFLVDPRDNLWIGTDGLGVIRQNPTTGELAHYLPSDTKPGALTTDQIFSLCADRRGTVWLGGAGGVLYRYLPDDDAFRAYELPLPAPTSIRTNTVRTIHNGTDGRLWLGTDGSGVFRFDPEQGTLSRPPVVDSRTDNLRDGRIFAIISDHLDNTWISVFGAGVLRIEAGSNLPTWYGHDTLSNLQVMPLLEDAKGMIWIGTNGGGLERLDPATGLVTHFQQNLGLPSSAIYGLLDDEEGHLWLSHNKGLTRFDPDRRACTNYSKTDGLQSNEFNGCAAYRSPTGELFFGGIDGYNRFHPQRIRANPFLPPVVITDFQIFSRSVPIGPYDDDRTILSQAIGETQELNLQRRDRAILFEYAALLYGHTDKARYAFRLQGLDKDWNYVGQRRFAAYNNLAPGQYIFQVKAANAAGHWGANVVSLDVNIAPEYWQTAWFRALAAVMVLFLPWCLYQYRTRLIRVRARNLEESVQRRTLALEGEIAERKEVQKKLATAHKQAVAATEAKSAFLATMSHEIRTPMNGVIGMAQLLLASPSLAAEDRELVQTIHGSGDSLLTIINDILDFSKIEAGKMETEAAEFDLAAVCADVAELIAPKAFDKGLELVCRYAPGLPRHTEGDAGRIRQVILNLLGNAVKFTESGQIVLEVTAETDGSGFRVAVHDTGIGLNAEEAERLFQPFSQADSSTTNRFGGTGLGLAISRKLVGIMGGQIGLDSSPGEGSTFWFTLPAPAVPTPEAPAANPLPPVRILIVDPVSASGEMVQENLAHWGALPTFVATDGQALHQLQTARAERQPFKLVIVGALSRDPDGDGLVQSIRHDPTLHETQVLLLSPAGLSHVEAQLSEQGYAGLLTKPVRPEKLQQATALLCAEPASDEPLPFLTTRNLERPPTTVSAARTAPTAAGATTVPAGTWHVLVAEDNLVNQRVAKRMLEKAGCQVDLAPNGREAVAKWLQNSYDVVFMDCRMPEMDGYTATAEIRSHEDEGRHTPIVAMTANVMEGDREHCLAAGMDDYLPKPLRMDDCHAALERWAVARQTVPVEV